jgi:hypothetical protein
MLACRSDGACFCRQRARLGIAGAVGWHRNSPTACLPCCGGLECRSCRSAASLHHTAAWCSAGTAEWRRAIQFSCMHGARQRSSSQQRGWLYMFIAASVESVPNSSLLTLGCIGHMSQGTAGEIEESLAPSQWLQTVQLVQCLNAGWLQCPSAANCCINCRWQRLLRWWLHQRGTSADVASAKTSSQ